MTSRLAENSELSESIRARVNRLYHWAKEVFFALPMARTDAVGMVGITVVDKQGCNT